MTASSDEFVIKDSGNRTDFGTGAVRDIQQGKGRPDLLPMDTMIALVECRVVNAIVPDFRLAEVSFLVFYRDRNFEALLDGILNLCYRRAKDDLSSVLLDLSRFYEAGCKKYGDRNWEKGIPLGTYFCSGIRHLWKYMSGEKDEDHLIAAIWNFCCLHQTHVWIEKGVLPVVLDNIPRRVLIGSGVSA